MTNSFNVDIFKPLLRVAWTHLAGLVNFALKLTNHVSDKEYNVDGNLRMENTTRHAI